MRPVVVFALLLASLPQANAQPAAKKRPPVADRPAEPVAMIRRRLPPPVLMVERGRRSVPMRLTDVDIKARIVGHTAETEITMTFFNPNRRVHEGTLYFPLPQGSTVSGYALDIAGTLVDGVVVTKHRARQVFEAEVRKGIDPGLVEWTKGQNFKTRVYPIPARGSRTIRVSYVSDVVASSDGAVYQLPLAFRDRVGKLSLRVEAIQSATRPVIKRGGPKGLRFASGQNSYIAETKLTNAKLTEDLSIYLPRQKERPVQIETAPDGTTYFSIRDHATAPVGAARAATPKRIGIYWDASRSRGAGDHSAEIRLLRAYLERLGAARVDAHLVVFRDRPERPKRFALPGQAGALIDAVGKVAYDGGTQLGGIGPTRAIGRVDFNLLFSDGVSNFGAEDPVALRAPTYAINASSTASHALLRYVAMRTGGAYLNLQRVTEKAALAAIGAPVFSFLSAEVDGATVGEMFPRLRVPVHGAFTLAGKLTGARATIRLKYGVGGSATVVHTFAVERSGAVRGDLLRRYWAQKKVEDLMVFPRRNEEAIAQVGRTYSIVTPGTSLLVLERLEQYVEHEVRPPASLPKMRAAYDAEMKQRVLIVERETSSRLERVLGLWKARVKWWRKRYKVPPNFRYGERKMKKMAYGRGGGGSADGDAMSRRRSAPRSAPSRAAAPEMDMEAADRAEPAEAPGAPPPAPSKELAKPKNGGRAAPPEATIELKPWDPSTPYLAALKNAPAERRYAIYLEQVTEHGRSPAFYLDCADFFRKRKAVALALRVLSNLAELELEEPALLRVLAHRLGQIGELDLSVQMFEEVLKLRPEEPQSYRDLALVLARRADERKRRDVTKARADYGRALSLLADVVMGSWDRFDEIEVIALTELNNIWARAKQVGVKKLPIDKRLITHLVMDVRIVMTWDADLTDMDLHVIEPSGEEAYYSHNRTTIGGLVSRDFTAGYGPEVYAVRRAMRGRYTVKTKFFGSSAAKLIGAVTLQVDVYTNYGRKNQKRKSITLRLTESKETFTVGSIKI